MTPINLVNTRSDVTVTKEVKNGETIHHIFVMK